MGILANLNSTRVIILGSFLGAAVMGGLVYAQKLEVAELDEQLSPRGVPKLVTELQTSALELANLQRLADREQFKQRDDAETYARAIAGNQYVNIGQIDTKRSDNERVRGAIDSVISLTPPKGGKTAYTRDQISNFLYKLEADSRRVRVTRVLMRKDPADKSKPHEVGADRWTFDVDITIRQPKE